MPLLDKEISLQLMSVASREKVARHAQEALQNKEKLQVVELIKVWAILAEYHMWKKEAEKCEGAYLECVSLIKSTQEENLLGECFTDLGDALYFCRSYERALDYYRKAVDIIKPLRKIEALTHIYSQMARCAAESGLHEEERGYLSEALELPLNSLIAATLIERIALSYESSGQYEKAASSYEEALSIYENQNFKRGWEDRIENLTKIYLALGDENAAQRTRNRR